MSNNYKDNEGWPDYIDPHKAWLEWNDASLRGQSYYDWDYFKDQVLSNREKFRHLEKSSGRSHRGPFSYGNDEVENDYNRKNYKPKSSLSIPFDNREFRDLNDSLNRIEDPDTNLKDDPESPKTREYVLRMIKNHDLEHVYLKLVELHLYQTANWISYNFFNKKNIDESKKPELKKENLVESKTHNDPQFLRMKDLMNKIKK